MLAKIERILTITTETATIITKPKATNQQQQRKQHIQQQQISAINDKTKTMKTTTTIYHL